jgi:3D (Asp-Asp-Asp) domain-containing protein
MKPQSKLAASFVLLAGAASLVSCSGGSSSMPPGSGARPFTGSMRYVPHPMVTSTACYAGDNGTPASVSDTVTFYGWPDNTPPGAAIAHPVIHATAGGDGSYCDPTTFATEPTKAENALIPYGTRIYIPIVDKYFVREDDCTASGPHVGSGSNGCSGVWTDLWIGGTATTKTPAVVNCENALTPRAAQTIVLHPGSNEKVNWLGPIYSVQNGCNKGGAPVTPAPSANPSSSPTSSPGGASKADILWYDYFQNGDRCTVADPSVSCAGGTGTYAKPITFAAPVSDNAAIPYGTRLYVPSIKKYFIRQDDCAAAACKNATTFTLWIGGNRSDTASDMLACEKWLDTKYLTNPATTIVLNPPSGEPVSSGAIWGEAAGTCNGHAKY